MEGSGNKWDNYVILGVSGNEGDRINTGAFVGEGGGRQWLFKKQSRLRCTRCNLELTIYFGESGFRSWWCYTDHSKSPVEEISKEYSCKYQVMKKALR